MVSFRWLVLCLGITTLFTILPNLVEAQCTIQNACFPWFSGTGVSQNTCSRGGSINLRFILDVAPEQEFGPEKVRYMTYGFCPTVDKLSSFTLNQSSYYATSYDTVTKDKDDKDKEVTEYHFSKGIYKNYLSVYGFGNSNNTIYPQRGVSNGAVLAAVNGTLASCGGPGTVAVVSTLMLNIGFRKGAFNYVESSPTGLQEIVNPNYDLSACIAGTAPPEGISFCNETITIDLPSDTKQPAHVGFEPTCKKGKCIFDSSAICIEDSDGTANCGFCYNSPTETLETKIQIWVSYFGTDSTGAAMISGGNSPLRYMDYATSSLADKFKQKLSDLWSGNYAP